jgi:hypothetical protein
VGGNIAQETPNLINIAANISLGGPVSMRLGGPGMKIKESFGGDQEAGKVAQYDSVKESFAFSEPRCGICGTPFPASHRHCEVCVYDRQGRRSRRRR